MVGNLEKSLYGTRDAALNWAEAHTKVLIAMGYKKGLPSPCSFHHAEWDLSTVVHGDDFFTEGPADSFIKMSTVLERAKPHSENRDHRPGRRAAVGGQSPQQGDPLGGNRRHLGARPPHTSRL